MSAKIAITRTDCTPDEIRQLAANCKDGSQARRLLAIASVMDGVMQHQEIARQCGTDLQTLCDWVHRFNLEGSRTRRVRGGRRGLTTARKRGSASG